MTILHTCLRYPPASGGAEIYIRDIVEHTRPAYDVRVLTSKMRTHGPISELAPDSLLDDPPYVQRLHHMATPLVSYPRLQALKYYIAHHQPDVIHGHGFWYQPADSAAAYARNHAIPFIFSPYYYEYGNRQKLVWQMYKQTIGKRTFAAADVVVTISPYEQQLIKDAGMPVKRFELIPPGIDVNQFAKPRPNPFRARNIAGNVLLTVSRLAPDKAIEDVVAVLPEIVKKFPETHLAIVGEDFGSKNTIESLAKGLGIERHIHFLGKLTPEELIGAYQHATVFVHPSKYEAFGIVLAEAQAAGCPVVARDIAAVPFAAPTQHGSKLFKTHAGLIDAIAAFLANGNLRSENGASGNAYVTQAFAWPVIAEKIMNLYGEFKPKTK